MKRVVILSPLAADTKEEIQKNIDRAQYYCRHALLIGAAPFASQGFYPEFLDDQVPAERALGMLAGKQWIRVADEIWIVTKVQISAGMRSEIQFGFDLEKPFYWFDPLDTLAPLREIGKSEILTLLDDLGRDQDLSLED